MKIWIINVYTLWLCWLLLLMNGCQQIPSPSLLQPQFLLFWLTWLIQLSLIDDTNYLMGLIRGNPTTPSQCEVFHLGRVTARQAGQPGSDWNRIVNVMPAMWHENGGENKCITFNGVWEERPRDCQNGRRISSQVLTQRHWTMGYDDESYGPLSWIICGLSSVHSQTISEMSRAVTVRHTSSDIENTEGLHCEIWRLFFRQMFMDYNNLSCRLVSADGHGLGSIK